MKASHVFHIFLLWSLVLELTADTEEQRQDNGLLDRYLLT